MCVEEIERVYGLSLSAYKGGDSVIVWDAFCWLMTTNEAGVLLGVSYTYLIGDLFEVLYARHVSQ